MNFVDHEMVYINEIISSQILEIPLGIMFQGL